MHKSDLQTVSSREAVVALLTNHGYHTPAALGMSAEALVHEIVHIERIAEEKDRTETGLSLARMSCSPECPWH